MSRLFFSVLILLAGILAYAASTSEQIEAARKCYVELDRETVLLPSPAPFNRASSVSEPTEATIVTSLTPGYNVNYILSEGKCYMVSRPSQCQKGSCKLKINLQGRELAYAAFKDSFVQFTKDSRDAIDARVDPVLDDSVCLKNVDGHLADQTRHSVNRMIDYHRTVEHYHAETRKLPGWQRAAEELKGKVTITREDSAKLSRLAAEDSALAPGLRDILSQFTSFKRFYRTLRSEKLTPQDYVDFKTSSLKGPGLRVWLTEPVPQSEPFDTFLNRYVSKLTSCLIVEGEKTKAEVRKARALSGSLSNQTGQSPASSSQ